MIRHLNVAALTMTHDHPKNETHQGFYAVIAVFYVLGKVTSHVALQFVPYPTQVVGKGWLVDMKSFQGTCKWKERKIQVER
jgi:hypothetical protein